MYKHSYSPVGFLSFKNWGGNNGTKGAAIPDRLHKPKKRQSTAEDRDNSVALIVGIMAE